MALPVHTGMHPLPITACCSLSASHHGCHAQYVDYGFTSGLEEQLDQVSGALNKRLQRLSPGC